MKSSHILPRLLLLILSILPLSSCERLFDQDANYRYKIENSTDATVEVVVEIKQNSGVNIVGDPNHSYTIEPGGTVTVWVTSGFTPDAVFDQERNNQELHWISVSASRNGFRYQVNLNDTRRWVYHKKNNYSAMYTLTLTEGDY
ncbi:hypothetical protein MKJ04_13215 [Pontibacter sp. E15-1]|uniref:hypothetical protein n=1 Tax=Pontibacter sp. E15-1 TaxID=2919918 RepID=UPI001F4F2E93|nr:hypothetical protein [Pontibacter sp. E15-1]MCJ8165806.1 hypothetical protein [Pontibacter sp. E15-1]